MRFGLRAASALLFLVLLVSWAQPTASEDRRAQIAALKKSLARSPGDLDTRLALARALAQDGARYAAYAEAERVVKAAPNYWEAHLLLAQIDGWEGRYDEAFTRLHTVLDKAPYLLEAVTMWADIALWAENGTEARRALL